MFRDFRTNMKRASDDLDRYGSFSAKRRNTIMAPDSVAIQQYIEEHGFGPKPPPLSRNLSADEFRLYYYDKQTLMEFCRSKGISTFGLKGDLNARIERYLRTGFVTVIQQPKTSSKPDSHTGLSLSKVVSNYKSDPTTRAFFQRHCPGFTGFSALVQKQIKERLAAGEVFTYKDVIDMHKEFLRNKKAEKDSGQAAVVAHNSCQFNQFYIDYSHDKDRKVHSAKEAWELVRDSAGEKTYQRYKDKIEEIRGILVAQELSDIPTTQK